MISKGLAQIVKRVPEIPEYGENGLPGTIHPLIERLSAHLKEIDCEVDELEARIQAWH